MDILTLIPSWVNEFSEWFWSVLQPYAGTKSGSSILILITLSGPLSFLPTIRALYTASGEQLKPFLTWTWPYMLVLNLATFVGVSQSGEWYIRLVILFWVLIFLIMNILLYVKRSHVT